MREFSAETLAILPAAVRETRAVEFLLAPPTRTFEDMTPLRATLRFVQSIRQNAPNHGIQALLETFLGLIAQAPTGFFNIGHAPTNIARPKGTKVGLGLN